MTKILVDVDDELMARVQELVGGTKKETVHQALSYFVRMRSQHEVLDWLRDTDPLADLRDPEVRARAVARHNRRVRTVEIIGIGMGDPEQLTLQAVAALGRVDVVLLVDKGDTARDLVQARGEILRRHARPGHRLVQIADPRRDRTGPDYRDAVVDWHGRRILAYEQALLDQVEEGGTAGILVWGDPALYDSTIRILDGIRARGVLPLDVHVTPGIGAIQALAAAHGVVLHGVGEPVLITTGRRLARDIGTGVPNVVVMLDADLACRALAGRGLEILWGAYLGGARQTLVRGPLDEVIDRIAALRAELRDRHGWIMDTYLLRPAESMRAAVPAAAPSGRRTPSPPARPP